jgi:endonuclease/exonuclease/phosphatase family metal-dependent hydrolase
MNNKIKIKLGGVFLLIITFFTGNIQHVESSSDNFKAISYNVGLELFTDLSRLQKIADLIAGEQPDVVGLQEYWHDTANGESVHPNTNRLLTLLAERGYPMYGKYEKRFDVTASVELYQMVLSKQSIDNYELVRFTGGNHPNEDMVQSFQYNFNTGGSVRVFNVHPQPSNFCSIVGELDVHLDKFSSQMGILMGDMNAWPDDSCLSAIYNDFRNTCSESSDRTCDYTIDNRVWSGDPNYLPEKGGPIDYIFVRKGTISPFSGPWTVIKTRSDYDINLDVPVSDHYPVISELIIPNDVACSTSWSPETVTAPTTATLNISTLGNITNTRVLCTGAHQEDNSFDFAVNGSWPETILAGMGNANCTVIVTGPNGTNTCSNTLIVDQPPLNGTCGAAQGSYLATDTYWRDPVCTTGLPSPLLPWPFLAPGATMNWQCVGQNGGTTASCIATRANNAVIPNAPSGLGVL